MSNHTMSIMTMNIMTVSIMTVSIMTASIMTMSIMTVSIMTMSIIMIIILPLSPSMTTSHSLNHHIMMKDHTVMIRFMNTSNLLKKNINIQRRKTILTLNHMIIFMSMAIKFTHICMTKILYM